MPIRKSLLMVLIIAVAALLNLRCDDAGVTTTNQNITFSQTNLKPLAASDSVLYELFVNFDTSGTSPKLSSMGKFNFNAAGQPINTTGSAMEFKFDFTPDLSIARDAIITMEPINDLDTLPNGTPILGATVTYVNGVLTYNFSMQYPIVLGNIATNLPNDSARYVFATPTDGDPLTQYARGIWFTRDQFAGQAGIDCGALDSYLWIYHAYVIDIRDSSRIYNVGRFTNPNNGDDYQLCNSNIAPPWNKPGQDWLVASCPGNGIPDIDSTVANNLNSGNYRALITVEPKSWTNSNSRPFFIRLFFGDIGSPGYGIYKILPNVAAQFLPTATLQITVTSGQHR